MILSKRWHVDNGGVHDDGVQLTRVYACVEVPVKKRRKVRLVKLYSPNSSGLDRWTAQQWKQQYASCIFTSSLKCYEFNCLL